MRLTVMLICLLVVSPASTAFGQGKEGQEQEEGPAQTGKQEAQAAKEPDKDAAVHIDYDEDVQDPGAPAYLPSVERLFQNPAFISGIASGADAINRSVESLMDSLFYSLLDNEKNFYITDNAWFSTQLKRDLFSTPSGAYVVVDRIALGPRYGTELWRAHGVPVSLGIDGTVEVLQIYLRTDGMRLAEQKDLPTWRRVVNNWFGILPGIASLMPPSFNQNEIYDPLRQLETPFVFPISLDGFYSMPVGSIRSYALSGGVQVPIDIAGIAPGSFRDDLERIGSFKGGLPYTIFKRGEHRINVLRHGEHSAWVGLKDLTRTGHSLSPGIGSKLAILKGALAAQIVDWRWVWAGVPVPLLPINASFEQAFADLFDQVYEYDLRNPMAQEAYLTAVMGDFVKSRERYLDAKEKGMDTGVTFHFARLQDRNEIVSRNGPNLAVVKIERQRELDKAEIEITDAEGKFYVLEASHDVIDKSWDLLVGEEEMHHTHNVEMRVRKVLNKDNPDDPSDYTFAYDIVDNPTEMLLSLQIQDRYVDVAEYEGYLEDLRFFSGLALAEVPKLDMQDFELMAERRRNGFFAGPGDSVRLLHVPPTYVGRFSAQASLGFSTEVLEGILSKSEDEMWAAFANAYGMDEEAWASTEHRATFAHQLQWFEAFFLYPLRLINIRVAAADAIKEASQGIAALQEVRKLETPLERLEAFNHLFDSDHPERLAKALLNLSDIDMVPRRISFTAQPRGAARHETKQAFGRLNNKIYKAGPPFAKPGRYARSKQKLANFYLDQPREAEDKPSIRRILVTTKELPASIRNLPLGDPTVAPLLPYDRSMKHVFVTMSVSKGRMDKPLKLYVKVEQAGRIKIGKLELVEKVIEIEPSQGDGKSLDTLIYEFFGTGPLSPLTNERLDQAVARGDELLVTVAASADGTIWSNERLLEFRFENGRLVPYKP